MTERGRSDFSAMHDLVWTLLGQSWLIGPEIFAVILGLILLVCLLLIAQFFRLWLMAYMANAPVSLFDLIGMRMRKTNAAKVVEAKVVLAHAGIHDVTVWDLEAHFLAGGRVVEVARRVADAKRFGTDLDWKTACAADLGRTPQAVRN